MTDAECWEKRSGDVEGVWRRGIGRLLRDVGGGYTLTIYMAVLRIGTRASLLATAQTGWVAERLRAAHEGLEIEIIEITSTGDRIQDRPLYEVGGKGLFTRELEQALLEKRVDLAVHSFKDVPVTMPLVEQSGLVFAAVPKREDPRDAIIASGVRRIEDLRQGAKVGTGSLRRRCQLLAMRSDLAIEPIRGNIDTRLRKLREGQYDAVILAMAGLKRAGLFDASCMTAILPQELAPSAGQGALALQCRADDQETQRIAAAMEDAESRQCVLVERQLVMELNGDCHSPIGALATIEKGLMTLHGALGGSDGNPPVARSSVSAGPEKIMGLVANLAERLKKQLGA
jgi:hydroxymethylbilane synthase